MQKSETLRINKTQQIKFLQLYFRKLRDSLDSRDYFPAFATIYFDTFFKG